MAKNKISQFDSTAANNTDIDGINIGEGMLPSNVNNALRALMATIKDFQTGADNDDLTIGGNITANNNLTVTGSATLSGNATFNTTGSIKVPVGTTAQRNGTPEIGMIRFNSTLNDYEGYNGTEWVIIGSGAGAVAGGVIYENETAIDTSYTISTGKNGFSVGPITVNSGVSITIPSGQRWVIL